MRRPPFRHRSKFGTITLRYREKSGTLTYEQKGGNQSTVDTEGVSLDAYVHALYGLILQTPAQKILMIGCGGGTLATMLARAGRQVTVVDIDPVSIKLARRHFHLPRSVKSHVGDGLVFMRKTRARFDAVVVDAFIGETLPAHMEDAPFFRAVRRCLHETGLAFVNVCLDTRSDRRADRMAAGFAANGWTENGRNVRLLDMPGGERNAIVLAGHIKGLRRPALTLPPRSGAAATCRALKAMRFRKRVRVS